MDSGLNGTETDDVFDGEKTGRNDPMLTSKKKNKPLIEKRRRARINECLEQLKEIIIKEKNIDNVRSNRLEKADILEMTVDYVRKLHREGEETPSLQNAYEHGIERCVTEMTGFLALQKDVIKSATTQNLINHCRNLLNQQTEGLSANTIKKRFSCSDKIQTPADSSTSPKRPKLEDDMDYGSGPEDKNDISETADVSEFALPEKGVCTLIPVPQSCFAKTDMDTDECTATYHPVSSTQLRSSRSGAVNVNHLLNRDKFTNSEIGTISNHKGSNSTEQPNSQEFSATPSEKKVTCETPLSNGFSPFVGSATPCMTSTPIPSGLVDHQERKPLILTCPGNILILLDGSTFLSQLPPATSKPATTATTLQSAIVSTSVTMPMTGRPTNQFTMPVKSQTQPDTKQIWFSANPHQSPESSNTLLPCVQNLSLVSPRPYSVVNQTTPLATHCPSEDNMNVSSFPAPALGSNITESHSGTFSNSVMTTCPPLPQHVYPPTTHPLHWNNNAGTTSKFQMAMPTQNTETTQQDPNESNIQTQRAALSMNPINVPWAETSHKAEPGHLCRADSGGRTPVLSMTNSGTPNCHSCSHANCLNSKTKCSCVSSDSSESEQSDTKDSSIHSSPRNSQQDSLDGYDGQSSSTSADGHLTPASPAENDLINCLPQVKLPSSFKSQLQSSEIGHLQPVQNNVFRSEIGKFSIVNFSPASFQCQNFFADPNPCLIQSKFNLTPSHENFSSDLVEDQALDLSVKPKLLNHPPVGSCQTRDVNNNTNNSRDLKLNTDDTNSDQHDAKIHIIRGQVTMNKNSCNSQEDNNCSNSSEQATSDTWSALDASDNSSGPDKNSTDFMWRPWNFTN